MHPKRNQFFYIPLLFLLCTEPSPPTPEEKPTATEPMETDPEPEPEVDPSVKKVKMCYLKW